MDIMQMLLVRLRQQQRDELEWTQMMRGGRWANEAEQPGHYRVGDLIIGYLCGLSGQRAKNGSTRRKCGHRRVVAGIGLSDCVLGAWQTNSLK